jgi:hypothetical protein
MNYHEIFLIKTDESITEPNAIFKSKTEIKVTLKKGQSIFYQHKITFLFLNKTIWPLGECRREEAIFRSADMSLEKNYHDLQIENALVG